MIEQVWKTWLEFLVLLAIGVSILFVTIVIPNKEQTRVLAGKRDVIQKKVDQLKAKVDRLDAEIKALQQDPEFIERRIRSELHFLRPNERIFSENERLPSVQREAAEQQ